MYAVIQMVLEAFQAQPFLAFGRDPEEERHRMIGGAFIIAFFLVTLPFLGAFISHAKGRERAEGYVLVTFFGPIGLIVALCLPRNP